jgi:phosphoribosylformylglycinamidine (FGAM) synthase-like enzyme
VLDFIGTFSRCGIDPAAGSRTAIAEALSNIVWAPIKNGMEDYPSANWMWACKMRRRRSFVRSGRKLF